RQQIKPDVECALAAGLVEVRSGNHVGQRLFLAGGRVGVELDVRIARAAGDFHAGGFHLGVTEDVAHGADIEARIVDRLAGEDDFAAADFQVLAVGTVGAVGQADDAAALRSGRAAPDQL